MVVSGEEIVSSAFYHPVFPGSREGWIDLSVGKMGCSGWIGFGNRVRIEILFSARVNRKRNLVKCASILSQFEPFS
jgi:hypothetical protein